MKMNEHFDFITLGFSKNEKFFGYFYIDNQNS
jgi:hypothetical protein